MEETTKPTAIQQPHPLANEIGRLLSARGLTLALAESCTGGLIGSRALLMWPAARIISLAAQ